MLTPNHQCQGYPCARLYFRASLVSIALLLLITLAGRAEAQRPYWDIVSCCSWHKEEGYNGFNPGLGREWQVINNHWSTSVTAAVNSKRSLTVYWELSWKPLELGRFRMGLSEICALGYDENKVQCIPPVPVLEYIHNKDLAFDSLVTPELVTLRIKRRF